MLVFVRFFSAWLTFDGPKQGFGPDGSGAALIASSHAAHGATRRRSQVCAGELSGAPVGSPDGAVRPGS